MSDDTDLTGKITDVRTLPEALDIGFRSRNECTACCFFSTRAPERVITFGELVRKARAIAGFLAGLGQPGDPVALLYPSGPEFITAFLGCLYARRVAVPLYPPRAGRKSYRADRIIEDSGATLALTTNAMLPAMSGFLAGKYHGFHPRPAAMTRLSSNIPPVRPAIPKASSSLTRTWSPTREPSLGLLRLPAMTGV